VTTPTQREPRWATVAEAAAYSRLSKRTIWRYIADERLTGYRVGPRLLQVDLNEIDNHLRQPTTAGKPDARAS
jgi:excisionase family DNA binding protein